MSIIILTKTFDDIFKICSRIYSARQSDRRFENLFIAKDSSSDDTPCQIFVDTAVYSRNRCFRLPLSSKAGKTSVLLPTGRFKCKDTVCPLFLHTDDYSTSISLFV